MNGNSEEEYWVTRRTVIRKHVGTWCKYRFLVVEPLDPADRDRSSSVSFLATCLSRFSSEATADLLWEGDCRS